jgi:hypothetical protein
MYNPLADGAPLVASGKHLPPGVAEAAPHSVGLAVKVGNILLDDVEALVASLPSRAELERLSLRERVEACEQLAAGCHIALMQVDDARTVVDLARIEAASR